MDSSSKPARTRRHTALFAGLLVGNTLVALGDALWEAAAVTNVVSIAPLIASMRLSPRLTAIVGGYSVVLAVLLGIPNEIIGTLSHTLRVGVCVAIAIAAVVIASLREQRERAASEARSSKEQLEAILQGVADGVIVRDHSGELVYANSAAAELLGYASVDDLIAAPVVDIVRGSEVMDEAGEALPVEELPGSIALTGREAPEATVRLRHRATDEERWALVKARTTRNGNNEVELAIVILEDITVQKRAELAQRFLAESSRVLAESLDYADTLERLAELGAAEIADWCAIDMLDRHGALKPVAIAHAVPEKARRLVALRSEYPLDSIADQGAPAVIRSAKSQLIQDPGPAAIAWRVEDAREREAFNELGLASLMIAPMVAGGETLGAITFASAESRRPFDADDLVLAEEVARRAAMAVHHARLYRERSHIATTLQRSLLPPRLPEIAGLELAARFKAQGPGYEVGGDFYDVFEFRPGGWAIVMGDVAGKGADAAAITALARYTLRTAAMHESTPSAILGVLNEALLRENSDRATCTAVVAVVDVGAQRTVIELASAGHPLPARLSGGAVTEIGAPGMLLGAFEDSEFSDCAVELLPGDALVLYTDGVLEAHAPARPLTTPELHDLLVACAGSSADAIAGQIEATAIGLGEGEPRDDIAIVALRARAPRSRPGVRHTGGTTAGAGATLH